MTKFFGMMAAALMLLMSWSGVAAADGHNEPVGKCEISPGRLLQGEVWNSSSRIVTEDVCAEMFSGRGVWNSHSYTRCDQAVAFVQSRIGNVFYYVVVVDGELVRCDSGDNEAN